MDVQFREVGRVGFWVGRLKLQGGLAGRLGRVGGAWGGSGRGGGGAPGDCGGSHHWGRVLQALGHSVRLIPPQYVKPFVKRGKNDRNDAEAISQAAARPDMRTVAVKSAERQAQAMLLSVRELLVRQRTQIVNALRGQAAEFAVVAKHGGAEAGSGSGRHSGQSTVCDSLEGGTCRGSVCRPRQSRRW